MSTPVDLLDDSRSSPQASRSFALWNLGFRPFYLAGAAFTSLSILGWIAQYAGYLEVAYLRGSLWHAHEMVFGFTLAVVAGFLFTAVRNWTDQPTPTGAPLAGLVGLWLAGRVLVLTPFALAAALVNIAFPLAVAIGIGVPLARSGNKRNYFFVALLLGISAATAMVHAEALGLGGLQPRVGLQAGLDVVLFVMAVMGGRVIPMFTNNGVPGAGAARHPLVERLALGSALAVLALDVTIGPSLILWIVAGIGALAHGARLLLWRPWNTLRTPLVWILHAAYAWIPLHLALRAAAGAGLVSELLATHALTIGAIGGLTIGMMVRTARGHTGRPLRADGFEIACFALVQMAAVIRVFGGTLAPSAYVGTVLAAGVLWSAAYGLYTVRYWPILTKPRLDGKPG